MAKADSIATGTSGGRSASIRSVPVGRPPLRQGFKKPSSPRPVGTAYAAAADSTAAALMRKPRRSSPGVGST